MPRKEPSSDEIEAIVAVLKQIRQENNFSIEGMARLLGFSGAHLSMIFAGKRRPGLRFLRAAAKRFPQVRRHLIRSLYK